MIPHSTGAIHTYAVPTLCTSVASPTAFGRYQTYVHVVHLNEVNGHVDFWMFRAHDSSLVPLVDTVKAMASKIPCTVFTPNKHLDPQKSIPPLKARDNFYHGHGRTRSSAICRHYLQSSLELSRFLPVVGGCTSKQLN